jgi:hypothetical protein
MLRKMHLVSPGYFHKKQPASSEANVQPKKNVTKSLPNKNVAKKRPVRPKQTRHPYNKWLRMRGKLEDAQVQRKTLINAFRDFLNQVLLDIKTRTKPSPKLEKLNAATQSSPPTPSPMSVTPSPATPVFRRFSEEVTHETPTLPVLYEETLAKAEVCDKSLIEQEVLDFNTRNFSAVASPYVSPYVYKKQPLYLDKQYGIRMVGNRFMISNYFLESIRKVISILRSLIQRLNLMRLPDCGSY